MGEFAMRNTKQASLTEQPSHWEQLFRKARIGLACGHVADNTFVAVNEAFARDRGYSVDELVGKPILSVYAPEVQREMKARFQEADRLGHLVYESVHQRKDGTRFPVLMEIAVIKDAKGKPVSRVAYALDITERKRAEQAIHENEERFRLVAKVTNDVLWDWDLITDDHWWSPNAREKFGYDPVKEPRIGAWRSRLHLEDRERVLRHLDECLRSGERTYVDEYRFLLANGLYGIFWDKGQVVHDAEGKPIRMIGAMIDVTAAKRAYATLEQAHARLQWLSRELQKAEEKERRRLSRELHDEFGQLLSALRLSLARIREEVMEPTGTKGMALKKNVMTATKTADRLFASLRELVRGLRPAILDEFGLVVALQSLAEDIRQGTGLDCRLSVKPKHIDSIVGQELEGTLYRIAQELMTNVVRHARATRADITLHYADKAITLMVRDNGRGGRFTTLKKGYGLRGIQERTELFGGEVEIQSERRRGTTVTVTIPMESLSRNHGSIGSGRPTTIVQSGKLSHGEKV
jgi:PAS domain S-box-containing protein